MRHIYKYSIRPQHEATLQVGLPVGSRVIHVGFQACDLCLWVEQPVGERLFQDRRFVVFWTGLPFCEDGRQHVGSASRELAHGGFLVAHVYEESP